MKKRMEIMDLFVVIVDDEIVDVEETKEEALSWIKEQNFSNDEHIEIHSRKDEKIELENVGWD